MSIFHNMSPVTLRLNPTLSQSVHELDDGNDSVAIENLKAVLFSDIHESREFFNLCQSDPKNFCRNQEEEVGGGYSCCDCHYAQCNRYDDVLYISQESHHYYKDTCPLCVLKVTIKCRRFWNCCITRMKHQKSFSTIQEVVSFQNSCYHFRYERAYIELCIEGNICENARQHVMRYFSSIDTPESFTSQ